MRKILIAALLFIAATTWTAKGYTAEEEAIGFMIGAGSGAVMGHAIGGNPEATFIGSIIGGAIGLSVGNAHRHGHPFPPPPHVVFHPPFPGPWWFDGPGHHEPGHDDHWGHERDHGHNDHWRHERHHPSPHHWEGHEERHHNERPHHQGRDDGHGHENHRM